ncbi:MAG: Gfo/Idh/MocA family protein [Myxococcota bacterium]
MSDTNDAVRFSVIGLDHPHVVGMAFSLKAAGAELVSVLPQKGPIGDGFLKLFPDTPRASSAAEILEDPTIQLIANAGIPNERAPFGLEVMRAGKDFLVDKPGFTTLDQLEEVRRVQRETGRIYSVYYSERHENRATVRAGELVQEGAIGRVLQTLGLGPHRLNAPNRPAWFFERERYGGILTDIASHQAEQFLFFTGATEARVVHSRVGNRAHPEYPGLEDFGEVLFEGGGATGYVRVDWFTPDGLPTWGDCRLMILGTEGTIEVRKEVDLAGRDGGNHLFLVDGSGVHHEDCSQAPLPFAPRLVADIRDRTETAMPQAHCFLASELALRAQAQADRIGETS